jgi:hypothetical protein
VETSTLTYNFSYGHSISGRLSSAVDAMVDGGSIAFGGIISFEQELIERREKDTSN